MSTESSQVAPTRQGTAGNVIAALCNVFVPGLGHLVQGRILGALFFFVTVWGCYVVANVGAVVVIPLVLYIPGGILHLFAILSAATWRGRPD